MRWLLLIVAVLNVNASGATDPLTLPEDNGCDGASEQPMRRRPGRDAIDSQVDVPCNIDRIGPAVFGNDVAPILVPDRWRIVETLGQKEHWWDPYHPNTVKGDKPISRDWFFNLTAISDTVVEPRRLPTATGGSSTGGVGQNEVFGNGEQLVAAQTFLAELVWYKGETVFRPPDLEFRITPAWQFNNVQLDEIRTTNIDPGSGDSRSDQHFGLQAVFVDYHLRNVSDRFDFDSLRVGIQPVTADFRGFLLNDSPLGVRLFGTRDNNRYQYNLGWFVRLEKDTNSGINDLNAPLRNDQLLLFNLYAQDFLRTSLTAEVVLLHDRNREADEVYYDDNGFLQRPAVLGLAQGRDYDVTWLGVNTEGRLGDFGLSTTVYFATGSQSHGVFVPGSTDVRAGFAAMELSQDWDWFRLRLSLLWASGDEDPFDDLETGYDAVFENPLFAGADTSFWIRQGVPTIGGGGVALSLRNGVLANLRSSREHGQANFTNPGLALFGLGADAELTPTWRISANVNQLRFDTTKVLEVARNQGGIDESIGLDVSVAAVWRPLAVQNIVLRLSAARLFPGAGFEALYGNEAPYSFLANVILTY